MRPHQYNSRTVIDIQISYEVVNPNQNMIILSEDESEQNERVYSDSRR